MLHQLREPLLLATRTGQIRAANVACADALGTSVSALEGASLASFSLDPAGLADRLRDTGADAPFPLRTRDGRRFFCDASALETDILLLRLSGGRESEPRDQAFANTLSRPRGITAGAMATPTLDEAANQLLTRVMTALDASVGAVYLVDKAGANLEMKANLGYADVSIDRFRLIPLAAHLPITDAILTRLPVVLGTADEYVARYPDFARTHPTIALRAAMANIPIIAEGRAIGILGLGAPLPWHPSEEALATANALAAEFGRAFELTVDQSERLMGDRARSQLERLHAFTGALAKAITSAQVAEVVVEMGMAATSCRAGGLWIVSDDGATVSLVRHAGPSRPNVDSHAQIPLDRPERMPILDAIVTGTPVWIESCQQMEEQYPDTFRAFSRGGDVALACLPMFAQGRCIGGIVLVYPGVHRFVEDERAFLQVMAWHSAQAVERSRLYTAEKLAREAAEAANRRTDFLAEIGTLLASSLDYASMSTRLAQAAVPRIACWCIVELEEDRLRGLPPIAIHADPSRTPIVLELSRRFRELGDTEYGIPGVVRSGKPVLLRSITPAIVQQGSRGDPKIAELHLQTGATSSMVVPITGGGRTLGAIALNTCLERPYDEHDLAMAVELGRRAGAAVDNARLYREARDADRLKDEFLAMLSHELRNPLTPIVTALDLMELEGRGNFVHERAIMSRQVRHLVRLVDDLLDVSKITRGKIELKRARHAVTGLIAHAVEVATPLLESRGQYLMVSARSDVSVMGDEVRLVQVIANLLTNASKYTEPGGRISIDARREGDEIVLTVTDSGIGISPALLPLVFEPFTQEHQAADRPTGGLGIGLTIVRNLVELHGGRVEAASAGRGQGSVFTIRLPAAGDEPAVVPAAPVPAAGVAKIPKRVLVVDDNVDILEVIGHLFRRAGHEVMSAKDGPGALEVLKRFRPDVAVLDIGLPVMDGYELAERMIAELGPAMPRLIALTGYGQDIDRARTRTAGFAVHLTKPIEADRLLLEIYASDDLATRT
jgi:signal transduction histidine kinase/ActR/RegA family two-component response regulator